VAKTDHPVKVTLVWNDFPALPDRYPSFVNNLDPIVSDPDGKDYHGNVFSQPYDGKLDAINNVESVLIPDPRPGKYRSTVLATEVLEGSQEFSLVYSGGSSIRE
jgi:serine protease AprX